MCTRAGRLSEGRHPRRPASRKARWSVRVRRPQSQSAQGRLERLRLDRGHRPVMERAIAAGRPAGPRVAPSRTKRGHERRNVGRESWWEKEGQTGQTKGGAEELK